MAAVGGVLPVLPQSEASSGHSGHAYALFASHSEPMHDLLRRPLLCLLPQAADGDVGVQAGGDRLPRLHPPAPAPDAGSHEELMWVWQHRRQRSHTRRLAPTRHASECGSQGGSVRRYWRWRGQGVAAWQQAWQHGPGRGAPGLRTFVCAQVQQEFTAVGQAGVGQWRRGLTALLAASAVGFSKQAHMCVG